MVDPGFVVLQAAHRVKASPSTIRDSRALSRPWHPSRGREERRSSVFENARGLGPLSFASLGLSALAKHRRTRRLAGAKTPALRLPPEDQWLQRLNLEAFAQEMSDLGRELRAQQGEEDLQHLNRVVWWSDLCAVLGLASMWMSPNPFTILALSLWTHSRWTMVAHHTIHGGYNQVDSSGHYSSKTFGMGSLWRRVVDWFDWMLPEAWSRYHNQVHHYRVNEPDGDPDYFEKYTDTWKLNRELMTLLSMLFFKWAFAAPNTYKALKLSQMKGDLPKDFDPKLTMTIYQVFRMESLGEAIFSAGELMTRVIGPYLLLHFVLLPLPFLLIGPSFFWHAVANLFLAELVANVHGFMVTTFNHTGEDIYCFSSGCRVNSPTFYLRAVIGSVNCHTGGFLNDFLHGYLNYQIEHHLWPDLSMLSYAKAQPKVKAICEKHGVPYVQENIFARMVKVLRIFTGRARMRRFPEEMERKEDFMAYNDRGVAIRDGTTKPSEQDLAPAM